MKDKWELAVFFAYLINTIYENQIQHYCAVCLLTVCMLILIQYYTVHADRVFTIRMLFLDFNDADVCLKY